MFTGKCKMELVLNVSCQICRATAILPGLFEVLIRRTELFARRKVLVIKDTFIL